MPEPLTADKALLDRLPLPLAQLFRRAQNAKSPLERHLNAFYLWEAGLKLLGSAAVVDYAASGAVDPDLAQRLTALARPALGHWWEFVRRLVPILADANVAGWPAVRDLLLGRTRDDMPRAAGLDAVLLEVLQDKHAGRATVRLTELFDRLVQYRNGVLGHAAPGQLTDDFNERLARALLAGVGEVWSKLDVLAGRRLVYVPEVRPARGAWLVQRYELIGESPRRLEALELPRDGAVPDQNVVYLAPGESPGGISLTSLHPLVLFDLDATQFLFLNARRGQARVEYLCYTTGLTVERADLGAERRELLAKVLHMPVSPGAEAQWAENSRSEFGEPEASAPGVSHRTLGEFELLSELGRGGMGIVYRAWQPSLGRQVALKKLLPSADLSRAEERFRREIKALARVDHPNLVKVFTSGADGDEWYFAMELVEGAPLSDVCATLTANTSNASTLDLPAWQACVSSACAKVREAEKPLSANTPNLTPPAPLPDAGRGEEESAPPSRLGKGVGGLGSSRDYISQLVTLVRQIADAAHALHECGIVHRDIKPGNIQLSRDGGRATLMDLGLAQIADEVDGRLTRTRQFVGTLRYASPEQVLSVGRLDRRSDVYSLGATLWELLTLRPLFGATDQTPTPQLMLDIQNREPDRLRKLNPSVGRDLEAVVHKCLEKRPEHRYATSQDLADDFGRVLDGEPVLARPVGEIDRAIKWAKRRPALAALGIVSLLAIAGLIGGGIYYNALLAVERQSVGQKEGELNGALSDIGRKESELDTLRGEAKYNLFRANLVLAGSNWKSGDALGTLKALNDIPADMRQWEWRYQQRRALGSYATLWGHAGEVNSVAFSPDGARMASGSHDNTVRLWDAKTGAVVQTLFGHTSPVTCVAFSPDGARLATGSSDSMVRIWDAKTGAVIHTLDGHTGIVKSAAFSSDGARLASGSNDKTVRLWDATTGAVIHILAGHSSWINSVAFAPDGARLASGSNDKTVQLWDATTGAVMQTLAGHTGGVNSVAFAPDGARLASASDDNTVRLWDAKSVTVVQTLVGHKEGVTCVAFAPDGARLASGSFDEMVRLWDTKTGAVIHTFAGHTSLVSSVAISPDGTRLASGSNDKSVRLWDAKAATAILTLTNPHSVTSVAFSPDGARMASGSIDKKVRLSDTKTGALIHSLAGHTNSVTDVAFSPDGARLASGSIDTTVRIWNAETGTVIQNFAGHTEGVRSVAFAPDGSRLASGGYDNTVRIWDAETGATLHTLAGHGSFVTSVAFSPDGSLLASGSYDTAARIWDAKTGAVMHTLAGHGSYVTSVAFSPDGTRLASGSYDGTVRLWDAKAGELIHTLAGHTARVTSVAYSPDGARLASGNRDGAVRLWDAKTGAAIQKLVGHTGEVSDVAFSPDGARLVSGSTDNTVRFWGSQAAAAIHILTGHTSMVTSMAFSPDSARLASCSYDSTVRLWDTKTGAVIHILAGHSTLVMRVAFSPDGTRLASRDNNQVVKAWNLQTGNETQDAMASDWLESQTAFAGSPDGRCHAIPQDDYTILLVKPLPPDEYELGYRAWFARPDPEWHWQQAQKFEKDQSWFAAKFHCEQLLKHRPEDAGAKTLLEKARAEMKKLLVVVGW